jgi:predicted esterase
MEQHKISVEKTARVFTKGNPDAQDVCILLHGYGMLAPQMLTAFEDINTDRFFLIAPEGLSRFYWKGFEGPVVASWMTKEDRQDEINDYVVYLNKLIKYFALADKKIHILGFSQGVATMSRWIASNAFQVESCIFWAGEPPADIDYTKLFERFQKVYFVYGKADIFITTSQLEKIKGLFTSVITQIEFVDFEGKHELNKNVINQLLTSNNSF